eukprot:g642.t1
MAISLFPSSATTDTAAAAAKTVPKPKRERAGGKRRTRTFTHSGRDFDTEGIIYHIGTSGGAHTWRNPGDPAVARPDADDATGQRVLCSSSQRSKGKDGQMLLREHNSSSDESGWTESIDNAWFAVDLGAKRSVCVSRYTMRQGNGCAKAKNWSLEGSNDAGWPEEDAVSRTPSQQELRDRCAAATWVPIAEYRSRSEFTDSGKSASFDVPSDLPGASGFYRCLRLRQHNRESSQNDGFFAIGGFEIYGQMASGATPSGNMRAKAARAVEKAADVDDAAVGAGLNLVVACGGWRAAPLRPPPRGVPRGWGGAGDSEDEDLFESNQATRPAARKKRAGARGYDAAAQRWDTERSYRWATVKDTGLTVSNTRSRDPDGHNCMVFAKNPVPARSGKYCWEIHTEKRTGSGNGYHFLGVATKDAPAEFATGHVGDNAWGLYLSSSKKVHGSNVRERYGKEWYNAGTFIGVVLDTDAGTLSFVMDGVDQGVAYGGLEGLELFPVLGVGCLEENIYTAKFDVDPAAAVATALPDRVPTDFAVILSPGFRTEDDAAQGPLKPGDVGKVMTDDQSSKPIQVRAADGRTWWYSRKALMPAPPPAEAARATGGSGSSRSSATRRPLRAPPAQSSPMATGARGAAATSASRLPGGFDHRAALWAVMEQVGLAARTLGESTGDPPTVRHVMEIFFPVEGPLHRGMHGDIPVADDEDEMETLSQVSEDEEFDTPADGVPPYRAQNWFCRRAGLARRMGAFLRLSEEYEPGEDSDAREHLSDMADELFENADERSGDGIVDVYELLWFLFGGDLDASESEVDDAGDPTTLIPRAGKCIPKGIRQAVKLVKEHGDGAASTPPGWDPELWRVFRAAGRMAGGAGRRGVGDGADAQAAAAAASQSDDVMGDALLEDEMGGQVDGGAAVLALLLRTCRGSEACRTLVASSATVHALCRCLESRFSALVRVLAMRLLALLRPHCLDAFDWRGMADALTLAIGEVELRYAQGSYGAALADDAAAIAAAAAAGEEYNEGKGAGDDKAESKKVAIVGLGCGADADTEARKRVEDAASTARAEAVAEAAKATAAAGSGSADNEVPAEAVEATEKAGAKAAATAAAETRRRITCEGAISAGARVTRLLAAEAVRLLSALTADSAIANATAAHVGALSEICAAHSGALVTASLAVDTADSVKRSLGALAALSGVRGPGVRELGYARRRDAPRDAGGALPAPALVVELLDESTGSGTAASGRAMLLEAGVGAQPIWVDQAALVPTDAVAEAASAAISDAGAAVSGGAAGDGGADGKLGPIDGASPIAPGSSRLVDPITPTPGERNATGTVNGSDGGAGSLTASPLMQANLLALSATVLPLAPAPWVAGCLLVQHMQAQLLHALQALVSLSAEARTRIVDGDGSGRRAVVALAEASLRPCSESELLRTSAIAQNVALLRNALGVAIEELALGPDEEAGEGEEEGGEGGAEGGDAAGGSEGERGAKRLRRGRRGGGSPRHGKDGESGESAELTAVGNAPAVLEQIKGGGRRGLTLSQLKDAGVLPLKFARDKFGIGERSATLSLGQVLALIYEGETALAGVADFERLNAGVVRVRAAAGAEAEDEGAMMCAMELLQSADANNDDLIDINEMVWRFASDVEGLMDKLEEMSFPKGLDTGAIEAALAEQKAAEKAALARAEAEAEAKAKAETEASAGDESSEGKEETKTGADAVADASAEPVAEEAAPTPKPKPRSVEATLRLQLADAHERLRAARDAGAPQIEMDLIVNSALVAGRELNRRAEAAAQKRASAQLEEARADMPTSAKKDGDEQAGGEGDGVPSPLRFGHGQYVGVALEGGGRLGVASGGALCAGGEQRLWVSRDEAAGMAAERQDVLPLTGVLGHAGWYANVLAVEGGEGGVGDKGGEGECDATSTTGGGEEESKGGDEVAETTAATAFGAGTAVAPFVPRSASGRAMEAMDFSKPVDVSFSLGSSPGTKPKRSRSSGDAAKSEGDAKATGESGAAAADASLPPPHLIPISTTEHGLARDANGVIRQDHEGFASYVVANRLFNKGRWYYEITVRCAPGSPMCPQLGWAGANFVVHASQDGVGDDTSSWGVDGVRVKAWHGGPKSFGKEWKDGDVIGVAADLEPPTPDAAPANTLRFSHNGSWDEPMGAAFERISYVHGIRPALTLGRNFACEVNFGEKPFVHAPPPLPGSKATKGDSGAGGGEGTADGGAESATGGETAGETAGETLRADRPPPVIASDEEVEVATESTTASAPSDSAAADGAATEDKKVDKGPVPYLGVAKGGLTADTRVIESAHPIKPDDKKWFGAAFARPASRPVSLRLFVDERTCKDWGRGVKLSVRARPHQRGSKELLSLRHGVQPSTLVPRGGLALEERVESGAFSLAGAGHKRANGVYIKAELAMYSGVQVFRHQEQDLYLLRWQRTEWLLAYLPNSTLEPEHLKKDSKHCLYFAACASDAPPLAGWQCAGDTAAPPPAGSTTPPAPSASFGISWETDASGAEGWGYKLVIVDAPMAREAEEEAAAAAEAAAASAADSGRLRLQQALTSGGLSEALATRPMRTDDELSAAIDALLQARAAPTLVTATAEAACGEEESKGDEVTASGKVLSPGLVIDAPSMEDSSQGRVAAQRWNPEDCHARIKIAEDGVTITNTKSTPSGRNGLVRGSVGYTSGKHFWTIKTIKRDGGGSGYHFLGIATAAAADDFERHNCGDEAWGLYLDDNYKCHGRTRHSYGRFRYSTGSVIGVLLDLDAADGMGELSFWMKGDSGFVAQGVAFSGLRSALPGGSATEIFPCMGAGCLNPNTYEANFNPETLPAELEGEALGTTGGGWALGEGDMEPPVPAELMGLVPGAGDGGGVVDATAAAGDSQPAPARADQFGLRDSLEPAVDADKPKDKANVKATDTQAADAATKLGDELDTALFADLLAGAAWRGQRLVAAYARSCLASVLAAWPPPPKASDGETDGAGPGEGEGELKSGLELAANATPSIGFGCKDLGGVSLTHATLRWLLPAAISHAGRGKAAPGTAPHPTTPPLGIAIVKGLRRQFCGAVLSASAGELEELLLHECLWHAYGSLLGLSPGAQQGAAKAATAAVLPPGADDSAAAAGAGAAGSGFRQSPSLACSVWLLEAVCSRTGTAHRARRLHSWHAAPVMRLCSALLAHALCRRGTAQRLALRGLSAIARCSALPRAAEANPKREALRDAAMLAMRGAPLLEWSTVARKLSALLDGEEEETKDPGEKGITPAERKKRKQAKKQAAKKKKKPFSTRDANNRAMLDLLLLIESEEPSSKLVQRLREAAAVLHGFAGRARLLDTVPDFVLRTFAGEGFAASSSKSGVEVVLESKHPYDNSADYVEAVEIPGATALKVEFDPRCRTESGYDHVRFYRQQGKAEEFFKWSGSDVPSPMTVPGDRFWLGFTSDSSNNDWGYKITVSDASEDSGGEGGALTCVMRCSSGDASLSRLSDHANQGQHWQSNGSTASDSSPHFVECIIPDKRTFGKLEIFRKDHGSYSPATLRLKAGGTDQPGGLKAVKTIQDFPKEPAGWTTVLEADDIEGEDGIKMVRVEVTRNHDGGCDTKICALRVTEPPVEIEEANGPADKDGLCTVGSAALEEGLAVSLDDSEGYQAMKHARLEWSDALGEAVAHKKEGTVTEVNLRRGRATVALASAAGTAGSVVVPLDALRVRDKKAAAAAAVTVAVEPEPEPEEDPIPPDALIAVDGELAGAATGAEESKGGEPGEAGESGGGDAGGTKAATAAATTAAAATPASEATTAPAAAAAATSVPGAPPSLSWWTLEHDEMLVRTLDRSAARRSKDPVMTEVELNDAEKAAVEKVLQNSPLAEGTPRAAFMRARALLLRHLNFVVRETVLPIIELSQLRASPYGRALDAVRGLVFWHTKEAMWAKEMTRSDTSRGKKEIVFNRRRAQNLLDKGKVDSKGLYSMLSQCAQAMDKWESDPKQVVQLLRNKGQAFDAVFAGEGGLDAGGLYREALDGMACEVESTAVPLTVPNPNLTMGVGEFRDRRLFAPLAAPPAPAFPAQRRLLRFLGQLMGLTLRTKGVLPLNLASLAWKALVREPATMEDLKHSDANLLRVMEHFADSEAHGITESVYDSMFEEQCFEYADCAGHVRPVRPGGAAQRVTYELAPQFAREVLAFRMQESRGAAEEVRLGLSTIVPVDLMNLWTWRDLERMVAGDPNPDIARLKRKTKYENIAEDAAEVKMLWDMLEDFGPEDRARFLLFVWGRSRLPFSDEWEPSHFKITRKSCSGNPNDTLPSSHTCFFQLDLPPYTDAAKARAKILYAITYCRAVDADASYSGGQRAIGMGWGDDDADDF